jgi:hypothetical protein
MPRKAKQVAEQTEQNTAAVVANVRQQSLDTEVAMLLKGTDYAGEAPAQGLSEAEFRADILSGIALRIRETQWLQFQDGLLDAQTWDSRNAE